MKTSTLLLVGALAIGAVLYMQSQAKADEPQATGATPMGGAPGFGFNLGFFKSG